MLPDQLEGKAKLKETQCLTLASCISGTKHYSESQTHLQSS